MGNPMIYGTVKHSTFVADTQQEAKDIIINTVLVIMEKKTLKETMSFKLH